MAAPYEILAAPLTVWVAPVGTAFPAVNAAPPGTWFQLGTSGTKNYDAKGVTVNHGETIQSFTPAGGTAKRKVWRSEETFDISFDLVDLTIEQYGKILNDAVVTTTVGPPAIKDINLLQGLVVKTFALLARGTSPVNETLPSQYQVPLCYESDSPQPVYVKSAPAALAVKFEALEDLALGFGKLIVQTA
jgi:hypothetical protein